MPKVTGRIRPDYQHVYETQIDATAGLTTVVQFFQKSAPRINELNVCRVVFQFATADTPAGWVIKIYARDLTDEEIQVCRAASDLIGITPPIPQAIPYAITLQGV